MPPKEGLNLSTIGKREPVNTAPPFHQTTSLTKRKSLPPPPLSKKAKKSKTSGSKGTREEDLQEGYDYVPDLAPEHPPYSNKVERLDGDPDYQSDQSESESESDGVNSDDEDQRRYDEVEIPGFNRHAPRIPPPQSNGDSVIGSNAQAIVIRQSKWWRIVSEKASCRAYLEHMRQHNGPGLC
jgi:hypothetical protein